LKEEKYIRCPYCESVNEVKGDIVHCRNCKNRISGKKEVNLQNAWALLIAAMVFYVIANLNPILVMVKFGVVSENTIMEGVISLWEEGSYPIAAIIFIASVFVPLLKFLLILYILINYKKPVCGSRRVDQAKLYHITEVIGPWSMIDVFVVAILTAVVHMNNVKIVAGVGATAFVLMVLLTMLSAMSIDIRLIKEEKNGD
jgi:paraquat-inducible protein A